MRRLIFYSLSISKPGGRPDLIDQLVTSIKSLRNYNQTIPVILFTYDHVPDTLASSLAPYGVHVHHQGSYEQRLGALYPRGYEVLNQYPLLHKFLNFSELAAWAPDQALFLDCDTIFIKDVEPLFERYAEAHCYGREEPTCRRSHYGYDPGYLDEDAVVRLGQTEGVQTPPPFNLGAVMLNHGLCERLATLGPTLVSYAWRFVIWMAMNPPDERAANYGEGKCIQFLRERLDYLEESELAAALPYPSSNRWILDQVVLWLTLGHLPDVTFGDFERRDVIQNGEYVEQDLSKSDWILCHYYTQNMARLGSWMREQSAADASETEPCADTGAIEHVMKA